MEADLPLALRRAVKAAKETLRQADVSGVAVGEPVRPCGSEEASMDGAKLAAPVAQLPVAAPFSAPPRLVV